MPEIIVMVDVPDGEFCFHPGYYCRWMASDGSCNIFNSCTVKVMTEYGRVPRRLPQCIAAEADEIDKKVSFLKKNLPALLAELLEGLPGSVFDDGCYVSVSVADVYRRLKEKP